MTPKIERALETIADFAPGLRRWMWTVKGAITIARTAEVEARRQISKALRDIASELERP